MHWLRWTTLLLIGSLVSCNLPSHQPAGIGTTKGGATGQVAAAIAKVVSTQGDFQVRTQPMAGTKQYIPYVNANRLEFGVANLPQVIFAIGGTSLFEGHPLPDLRMVATLMPFRVGLVVPDRSDIQSVGDLRALVEGPILVETEQAWLPSDTAAALCVPVLGADGPLGSGGDEFSWAISAPSRSDTIMSCLV